jgi:catechol 2,3-dioxygenase-like lactoylglutathione lyase family enzyme
VKLDMKLEVVVIPVADADRLKAFYERLGWRLDADFPFDNGLCVIQFTPPGSAASIQFGSQITAATPGSARGPYLVVSDIQAARDALAGRGVEISEVFHPGDPGAQFAQDGGDRVTRATARSQRSATPTATNGWCKEVTQRLPGRSDAAETRFASTADLASAMRRVGCARRARAADGRRVRRELAGLVRRLHGGRTGRDRAADMSADWKELP